MYMYVKLSSLVANTEGLYSTFVHDAHVAFADNVHSPSGVHFCTFVSCIDRTALIRQTTCTIWTSAVHSTVDFMSCMLSICSIDCYSSLTKESNLTTPETAGVFQKFRDIMTTRQVVPNGNYFATYTWCR